MFTSFYLTGDFNGAVYVDIYCFITMYCSGIIRLYLDYPTKNEDNLTRMEDVF